MFAQLGREMRRGIIKKLEAAMRSTSIAFLARSISPSCEQGEGGGRAVGEARVSLRAGHGDPPLLGRIAICAQCVCIVIRGCTLCATCIGSIAYVIAVHDIRWQNHHAAQPPPPFLSAPRINRINRPESEILIFPEREREREMTILPSSLEERRP